MGTWNSFIGRRSSCRPGEVHAPDRIDEHDRPAGVPDAVWHPHAGTLLSILPVAVLFFVLQKDFIAGLATGAVKG